MRAFLLSAFLALVTLNPAFAGTPPGFDAAKWDKLVGLVAFVGEQMNVGDGLQLRSFGSLVPNDKAIPHKADYFSTMGAVDSMGIYHPFEVSAVSEDWRKRENGDWEIEQWIWKVSLTGELRGVMHTMLVETHDGSVLDIINLPVGTAQDPAELERWGAKLGEWYQRYP